MSSPRLVIPDPSPSRVGVTGHSNLTRASGQVVERALRAALAERVGDAGLVGVTCLAPGADCAFARVVLGLGGALEVVLPARDYRDRVSPEDLATFDRLVASARTVTTLPFDRACRDAYVAANEVMLSSVDEVLAVWDGRPAVSRGSTGEVVEEARVRGLPVTVLWPPGCARTARAGEPEVRATTP